MSTGERHGKGSGGGLAECSGRRSHGHGIEAGAGKRNGLRHRLGAIFELPVLAKAEAKDGQDKQETVFTKTAPKPKVDAQKQKTGKTVAKPEAEPKANAKAQGKAASQQAPKTGVAPKAKATPKDD